MSRERVRHRRLAAGRLIPAWVGLIGYASAVSGVISALSIAEALGAGWSDPFEFLSFTLALVWCTAMSVSSSATPNRAWPVAENSTRAASHRVAARSAGTIALGVPQPDNGPVERVLC